MWPLLDLQFHCAFLSFDAEERIRNYIISGPISSSFWVFLHGFERYNWGLLEPIFILWMWPLLDLQFHCAFFSFDAGEGKGNYIIAGPISLSFWVFLHGFERYNWRLLEPIFILWMWPLLDLQFHCAFFELWCRRGERELHYFWSHFFVFLGVRTCVWKV